MASIELPHEIEETWQPVAHILRTATVYDEHQFADLIAATTHPSIEAEPQVDAAFAEFVTALDAEAQSHFLCHTLPFIIRSALKIQKLFPTGLAQMITARSTAVCLSEVQISALLANGFLSTIPVSEEGMDVRPSLPFRQWLSGGHSPQLQRLLQYFDHMRSRLEPDAADSDDENDDLVSVEVHGVPRAGLPEVSAYFQAVAPLRMCYRLTKEVVRVVSASFLIRTLIWLGMCSGFRGERQCMAGRAAEWC